MPLVGWSRQDFCFAPAPRNTQRGNGNGGTVPRAPLCNRQAPLFVPVSKLDVSTTRNSRDTAARRRHRTRSTNPDLAVLSHHQSRERNPQHKPCWPRDCCGTLVRPRQQQGRPHPSSHRRHRASPRRRSTPVGVPSTARPPVEPSAPRSSSAASSPPGRSSPTAPRRASRTPGGGATRSSLSSLAPLPPPSSTMPTPRRCP